MALGLRTTQIRTYVSGLTDVLLRTDTRVTNHGYEDGIAIPIQSVLQAGTAVFVDKYGSPVVKCYCGNPLTPPVLYRAPDIHRPPVDRIQHDQHHDHQPVDDGDQRVHAVRPGHRSDVHPDRRACTAMTGRTRTDRPQPSRRRRPPRPGRRPPRPRRRHRSTLPSRCPPTRRRRAHTVTLSASGFASGASLQITVNRPDGVVEHYPLSAGPDGTGTYTFSNAAGNAPLGTYSVTVTNTASGASASGSVDVIAPPTTSSSATTSSQRALRSRRRRRAELGPLADNRRSSEARAVARRNASQPSSRSDSPRTPKTFKAMACAALSNGLFAAKRTAAAPRVRGRPRLWPTAPTDQPSHAGPAAVAGTCGRGPSTT